MWLRGCWRWASVLSPALASAPSLTVRAYGRAGRWNPMRRDATELAFNGHGGVWLRLQLAAHPSIAMAADWQQRRPAAGYGEQVAAPSPAAAGKQQTGRALGQSRSAELRVHATGGPTIIPLVCGAGELCRRNQIHHRPRAASRAAAAVFVRVHCTRGATC